VVLSLILEDKRNAAVMFGGKTQMGAEIADVRLLIALVSAHELFDLFLREHTLSYVNVEFAVKMVDLVAEAARRKTFAGYGELLSVSVHSFNRDLHGTAVDAPLAGYGQTAFESFLLAFGGDDLRVDQLVDLVVVVRVYNEADTADDSDLRCGKTDALGIDKSLSHIVKESENTGSDCRYRLTHLAESFISLFYYVQKCHFYEYSFRQVIWWWD